MYNYAKAMAYLARDVAKEREGLEATGRANERRLKKKERWASGLGTIAGLATAMLTGGTPLAVGLYTALASGLGRAIGSQVGGKLTRPGTGKFYNPQREEMREKIDEARRNYLWEQLYHSIVSGVTAGLAAKSGTLEEMKGWLKEEPFRSIGARTSSTLGKLENLAGSVVGGLESRVGSTVDWLGEQAGDILETGRTTVGKLEDILERYKHIWPF